MQLIEALGYYVGKGLRVRDGNTTFEMSGTFYDDKCNYPELFEFVPLMRSMKDLEYFYQDLWENSPASVDLEDFAEVFEMVKILFVFDDIQKAPFWFIDLLLKRSFNIFELPEDQWLNIKLIE